MIHLLQRAIDSIEAEGGSFPPPPPREQGEDRLGACIASLLQREKRHARRDYLNYAGGKGPRRAGAVDAACRSEACRWMLQVARGAGLRRETAVAAVGYADGFLCSGSPRARRARVFRRDFMLVAMTCLRIAIGAHEPTRREIDAASVAGLSKGLLSARDINECERDILAHMRRGVQAPTALQFLRCIVDILPASAEIGVARKLLNYSYRQIEASTMDYACVILQRSTVAVASVLNSLEGMPEDVFASSERVAFIERTSEALRVDVGSPLVKAVRRRLISRCTRRSGTAKTKAASAVLSMPPRTSRRPARKRASVEDSPVCVIRVQEAV